MKQHFVFKLPNHYQFFFSLLPLAIITLNILKNHQIIVNSNEQSTILHSKRTKEEEKQKQSRMKRKKERRR
jgi:hypothetical protein